ncbi:hypothetical protein COT72_02580 [archaeon CG10_big_fil_rev_8_21_14_0_10_43_11]|nr:MAG: hypothetical protein COT72_02580 [archaeon CG10_big_fil_rev_8_21_14_0_10_43_11]
MSADKACPLGIITANSKKKLDPASALKLLTSKERAHYERVANFDEVEPNHTKANEQLNAFFEELARAQIKQSASEDTLIVQAVKYAQELDTVINRLFEQLFEWFSVYYPEAALKIESTKKFGRALEKVSLERNVIAKKLGVRKDSMGANLKGEDLAIIERRIREYSALISAQEDTKKYVEAKIRQVAPNLSAIATPLLGAKLIESAGSLRSLARMPSSTIQVIGAEKALFMHLKSKTKPPKHGIILQHPLVMNAPFQHRGKLARSLASKISIAAKEDYYNKGTTDISKKILKQLKDRSKSVSGGKKK